MATAKNSSAIPEFIESIPTKKSLIVKRKADGKHVQYSVNKMEIKK